MQRRFNTHLPNRRPRRLTPLLRLRRPRRPGRRLFNPGHERERLPDRDALGRDGHDLVLRAHAELVDEALGGGLDLVVAGGGGLAEEAVEAGEEAERVEEGRLGEGAVGVGCGPSGESGVNECAKGRGSMIEGLQLSANASAR